MLNLSFGNAYTDCSKLHTALSRCESAVGLCGVNSAIAECYLVLGGRN